MKKHLIAVAAALLGATGVQAADMAARHYTKAAPMVAMYDWSGLYIGANGGGAINRNCGTITALNFGGGLVPINPGLTDGCHDATGGTAGGQVGYRFQSASWVFGVEAQGNWADLKGSNRGAGTSFAFGVPTNVRSKIDALGLFTGQVGYSWNNVLLYVKGGAAVSRNKYDSVTTVLIPAFGIPAGTVLDRASETRWGGVVGVGGEYGFAPNWSFALEYDHVFMADRDQTFGSAVAAGFPVGTPLRTSRIREDVDMFTARVNYHFNSGGGVVAKY